MLTPLHITMLLHYHISPEPYSKHDPEHANSKAVSDFRHELLRLELIERHLNDVALYTTTDKGHTFVDMLCATPMPVQKWAAP